MYDIIFPWTPKADHRRPQVKFEFLQVQGSVTIATGGTFLHEPGFLVCQFAEISVTALNATELGFAGAYMMTTDQPSAREIDKASDPASRL